MRVACFSTKAYDRRFLTAANAIHRHEVIYLEPRLTLATARLAHGFEAVCAFVNDELDASVLEVLRVGGTRLIALRSAGYNHVDRAAAQRCGMAVVHVPNYSPHAVAEHTIALILALNRHVPRASNRVRERNFSIEGLLGFDLHGKTVGLIGVGKIGFNVARILHGFGCRVLAVDPALRVETTPEYISLASLEAVYAAAEIISLHCPLTPATRHLIGAGAIQCMKRGVMLINTSRGALMIHRKSSPGCFPDRSVILGWTYTRTRPNSSTKTIPAGSLPMKFSPACSPCRMC